MTRTVVVRQPTLQQGRALETLGHAIEYLIDSHGMCEAGGRYSADFYAVLILKKANHAVFLECPKVEPLFERMWRRFQANGRKRRDSLWGYSTARQARNRPERSSGIHAIAPR